MGAAIAVPVGLVFDAEGNLYVSQCRYDRSVIDRIDAEGQLTRFAGTGPLDFLGDGGPATSAAIWCPVGMAIGPDASLYFADHGGNRVRRIDGAGVISTVAGSGPAGVNLGSYSGDGGPAVHATLQEPWAVTFDAAGNLFIADRDNDRVRKVDLNGTITTVAGTGERGSGGDGGPAASAGLAAPLGLAVSADGALLIADSENDQIRTVDRSGTIHAYLGADGTPTTVLLHGADALAIDSNGALIVSSTSRIRRLTPSGKISTIAGDGDRQPEDGMPAIEARFGEVHGLAFDDADNLYVTDEGHNAVYRIDTNGILTLFAGIRP